MIRSFVNHCMRYVVFAAFALPLGMASAGAEAVTSAYTKINLEDCDVLQRPGTEDTFGGSWICEGFQGIPVYVAEGDLRMFVSFGERFAEEPAASQTLPNFNTINDTLEWRLRSGVPFATILRWFPSLDEAGKTGSVLIVTQLLSGGETCQIARVDARANREANVLARQAADQLAGNVQCKDGPKIIGKPGMLR